MCLLLRRRGGCARLASFLQSSGTSASAIKVACTPISSPVSDKCLGFSHHWSLRVGHRTCPSQNTHAFHCLSLSLSDPMNDRSKDCARRHSARQLGVLLSFLTLAHCRHSAPISGGAGFLLCAAHVHLVSMWSWGGGVCLCCVCDNMWGREAVSSTNRQSKIAACTKGSNHTLMSLSVFVVGCSHGVAQTYACSCWSSSSAAGPRGGAQSSLLCVCVL